MGIRTPRVAKAPSTQFWQPFSSPPLTVSKNKVTMVLIQRPSKSIRTHTYFQTSLSVLPRACPPTTPLRAAAAPPRPACRHCTDPALRSDQQYLCNVVVTTWPPAVASERASRHRDIRTRFEICAKSGPVVRESSAGQTRMYLLVQRDRSQQ